jgi:ABC-type molybdate transport system substrate-binding protein
MIGGRRLIDPLRAPASTSPPYHRAGPEYHRLWHNLARPGPGRQAAEVVAKGEAELGIAQASEIVPVAGAQLVGPLPGELASTTVFTGGIGAGSKSPEAAKALIRFLTRPEAASHLKTKQLH